MDPGLPVCVVNHSSDKEVTGYTVILANLSSSVCLVDILDTPFGKVKLA